MSRQPSAVLTEILSACFWRFFGAMDLADFLGFPANTGISINIHIILYIYIYYIRYIYIYIYCYQCPVVPHKAVAEVSKIGNLQERLVVVNQGWQSESTDGPKGA